MKYKIGEFCRHLGVSPDTLRYYEKCGLVSPRKDPGNKYRSFTRQDALEIWGLHMLRSLDMGIAEMGALRKQGSFEAQIKHLHKREATLKAEIERLAVKRERLLQLSRLYSLIHDVDRAHMQEEMSANYALYVLGEGSRPGEQTPADIKAWVAALPFTYFAVEISHKSLTGEDEELSVRMGIGILEENLHMAGLTPGPGAVYTPKGAMACMALRTGDVFRLTKRDLAPLYAYLADNRLGIAGPAAGRIVCSTYHEEGPEFIVAIGVPVEKILSAS